MLERTAERIDNRTFLLGLEAILAGLEPIVFHYQPIVDLVRGVATGYEALVRFPPSMGNRPDVCFQTADLFGKRLQLEKAVSLAAIASRADVPPNCFLSLNVSPAFLISDEWAKVLASVDDLAGLVIEVTEEESIHDYEPIRERLDQIRSLHGSVAIDDAGAGYASLKHVIEMRPSFIKLDRMFVAGCDSQRAKSTLIEMMGKAAGRLDSWIIAEGIETEAELDELLRLSVPLGQGYYLGRPAPVMGSISEEVTHAIRSHSARISVETGLHRHLQPCSVADTPACACSRLSADDTLTAIVVVDEWNRPVEIVERHPLAGIRRLLLPMKIQVQSNPGEVLDRALNRPAASRFDPFVVIDPTGAFQGIITVDKLMRNLLK